MQTNDRAVVRFGIGVWAVLLVVAIALHGRLAEQGRGWWVWTPVAAIALGLYGLHYIERHDRSRNRGRSPGPDLPAGPGGAQDRTGS
jgi:hypothetical protein